MKKRMLSLLLALCLAFALLPATVLADPGAAAPTAADPAVLAATTTISATVNGSSAGVKVTRMNNTKAKVTYTLSKATAAPPASTASKSP